jgi:Zn finger protein HypA/HybF involved in hydrogenase expression
MVIVLVAFVIDAGVLFFRAFPEMPFWLKLIASANLGFGLAFPLLLTSINNNLLPKWRGFGFPELFAICTTFMIALFFDIIPGGLDTVRWFLSIMLGLIDYLYAFLFVNKYSQQVQTIDLGQKLFFKEAALDDAMKQLKEKTTKLNEYIDELNEAEEELNEYRQSLTCPHCSTEVQTKSYSAYRNHVGRCEQNPKNINSDGVNT